MLAPGAWFLAAALSRARYLAICGLAWPRVRGQRGRRERRERIRQGLPVPARPSRKERALGLDKGDDLVAADGVTEGSTADPQVKLALGALLCALLGIIDIRLVCSVSDSWDRAIFCNLASLLLVSPSFADVTLEPD